MKPQRGFWVWVQLAAPGPLIQPLREFRVQLAVAWRLIQPPSWVQLAVPEPLIQPVRGLAHPCMFEDLHALNRHYRGFARFKPTFPRIWRFEKGLEHP